MNYPDSVLRDSVLALYKNYLRSFLAGLDNTPLVSYNSRSIDIEFITAFRSFLETYPDSNTAASVETLLTELKAEGFTARMPMARKRKEPPSGIGSKN